MGDIIGEMNQLFDNVSPETFFPLLQSLTFRTETMAITEGEARALLQMNRHVREGRREVNESERSLLDAVTVRLQSLLEEKFNSDDGVRVFAKLADFSPKDAVGDDLGRIAPFYRARMRELREREEDTHREHRHLRAMLWAKARMLLMHSAEEVLSLFSRSERICDELERRLEMCSTPSPVHIVLREWVGIDPQFEFRGFVCDNQLRGLSFMSTMGIGPIYYPLLDTVKNEVGESAKRFYEEQVAPKLKGVSSQCGGALVCDVYLDRANNKWFVIELNPWETSAAGHLFSADMHTLPQRPGTFEFRLPSETPQSAYEQVPEKWKQFWEDEKEKNGVD